MKKGQKFTAFKIQNLLYKSKNGTISGAMSPVLFIKEISEQLDHKYNGIGRVWLDDSEIHNVYEGKEGLTGHDTLITRTDYKNCIMLALFVDMGVNGIPVAMGYNDNKGIVITPLYSKQKFEKKLSESDIKSIFDYVYKNDLLIPKETEK